jgi:hypothetical protein
VNTNPQWVVTPREKKCIKGQREEEYPANNKKKEGELDWSHLA